MVTPAPPKRFWQEPSTKACIFRGAVSNVEAPSVDPEIGICVIALQKNHAVINVIVIAKNAVVLVFVVYAGWEFGRESWTVSHAMRACTV